MLGKSVLSQIIRYILKSKLKLHQPILLLVKINSLTGLIRQNRLKAIAPLSDILQWEKSSVLSVSEVNIEFNRVLAFSSSMSEFFNLQLIILFLLYPLPADSSFIFVGTHRKQVNLHFSKAFAKSLTSGRVTFTISQVNNSPIYFYISK